MIKLVIFQHSDVTDMIDRPTIPDYGIELESNADLNLSNSDVCWHDC